MVGCIGGGEFVDRRRQADGADGDAARTDPQSEFAIFGHGQGGQDSRQVGKGLAHPHHDDVTEPLVGFEQMLKLEHLLENFASG